MSDLYDIRIDELDEATCWRLLARAGFGRVGFHHDDEILVLPVNATVSDRRVVFRTGGETSLAAVSDGQPVAFEVDHTDRVAESGWSVLVRGRLWDVTDGEETKSWNEYAVRPWVPGERDRWMLIEPTAVTGRMVQRSRRLGASQHLPSIPPD